MSEILVAGATGFTGSHVIPLLLSQHNRVTCFVRPTSDRSAVDLPGVEFAEGNLSDPVSLLAALRGKDTLIHLANLMGSTKDGGRRARTIVDACTSAGIGRAVFVSSASVFTRMDTETKAARLAAEGEVSGSGLRYTMFRPTMIYGSRRDRNMIRLIDFLRYCPLVPVPGDGESLTQPIHVMDLAGAIVDCLGIEAAVGRTYTLSGAAPLTFNEVIDQVCAAMGVRRIKIHVPLPVAQRLARLANRLQKRVRITSEQLLRLNENKVFDYADAQRDIGFHPRTFAEGIRLEAACLRPKSAGSLTHPTARRSL